MNRMVSRFIGALVVMLNLRYRAEASSRHFFSSPWPMTMRSGFGSREAM